MPLRDWKGCVVSGSLFQQSLHSCERYLFRSGSKSQGCAIRGGATSQQHFDGLRVAIPGSGYQGAVQIVLLGRLQQEIDTRRAPGSYGEIPRKQLPVRTAIDQHSHDRFVAGAGSPGKHRLALQLRSVIEQ